MMNSVPKIVVDVVFKEWVCLMMTSFNIWYLHQHMIIYSFFTNLGRVILGMKGYEIPEYGRTAKGLPIVNLLKLDDGEKIATIIKC